MDLSMYGKNHYNTVISLQLKFFKKFMNHKCKPFLNGQRRKHYKKGGVEVMNFIMKLPANHFSNQY